MIPRSNTPALPQRRHRHAVRTAWTAAIAICCTTLLLACGGGDDPEEPTPIGMSLAKIGSIDGGARAAAEITAYDATTKRLFIVNGAIGTLDVADLSVPTQPKLLSTIQVSQFGGSVNSVAVHAGLVAVAIASEPKTSLGTVAFYDAASLQLLGSVQVGALPDMLVFTPDGKRVLVANEGEPNSYEAQDSVDPEGSVSIITVHAGINPQVATADFKAFIGQEAQLRAAGVRIYGPGANAAQDLEPEYIAITDDGKTAYVTLQENNAIAVVDIAAAKVTAIKPLGLKDHSVAGMGMDASDEDGGTNTNSGSPAVRIATIPVKGMYQPDAIAQFKVAGKQYLITANEGDARDWPGFTEEARVRSHCSAGLDPQVFADPANLVRDSNLGRLRITIAPNGGVDGKNAAGQCNALHSFGGRSFTIWDADVQRVHDSGDDFEQRTKGLANVPFNSSHDNATLDSRSPSKGPEPEGVAIGKMGAKTFAFIVLERVGGVLVYDVSNPVAPVYVTYLNTRDGQAGDRGPEGVLFVPAAKSPNGKPLLIVGHEESGTTSVLQVNLSY